MSKLTGYQRFQLRLAWLKGDKALPFEEYVKKVCKAKGIEYVEAKVIERKEFENAGTQ